MTLKKILSMSSAVYLSSSPILSPLLKHVNYPLPSLQTGLRQGSIAMVRCLTSGCLPVVTVFSSPSCSLCDQVEAELRHLQHSENFRLVHCILV